MWFTFAFECSGTPPPTALSGTLVSYGILNRYDSANATLDESQQLFRDGAGGLIASTNPNPTGSTVPLGCAAVNDAAEVIWPSSPDLGSIIFGIAPILTGAGLIAAGAGVVRSAVWTGWARLAPVVLGTYTFLVLIPVVVGSGGPPAPAALWAIAGWDLLWLSLAASVLTRPRVPAVKDQAHPAIAATPVIWTCR